METSLIFIGVVKKLPSSASIGSTCIYNSNLYTYDGANWIQIFYNPKDSRCITSECIIFD